MRRQDVESMAVCLALVVLTGTAAGQQMTVSTPYHAVGDSFFENIGTSWGINAPGFTFRFGSPNVAAPHFGGFNPGAGGSLGIGFRRNGASGFFNANFSQGSQRSFVSQVPSITVASGVPGFMAAGSASPFVIGYVPVVGGFPTIPAVFPMNPAPAVMPSSSGVRADAVRQSLAGNNDVRADRAPGGGKGPDRPADFADSPARKLADARASSAGRAAPSVREAKRLRAAEEAAQQNDARVFFEKGINAEEAGNLGAAKAYYQMAARRAVGDFQREILQRIEAVQDAPALDTSSRRAF